MTIPCLAPPPGLRAARAQDDVVELDGRMERVLPDSTLPARECIGMTANVWIGWVQLKWRDRVQPIMIDCSGFWGGKGEWEAGE